MRNVLIICRKELRSYFVSPIAYLLLTMFALIFGFFFWNSLGYFVLMGMESQMRGQTMPMNLNEIVIRPLLSNVGVIGLFFIPMITMRLFAEEKRSGTIELLATSPIRDVEIILGKWLAALSLYACMLLVAAVNFAFLFRYGNPDWKPLAIGYLGLLLQAGGLLAIGTFISTLTKNQIIAGAATFGVCLLLWVLEWVSGYETATWAQVLAYMSIITHFESFAKGVLDSKDAIFYVAVIFLGLFFTARSMESLRWRTYVTTQLLKARQTRYAAYAAIYVLVVITAVVIVNVLANRYSNSYDGTSNKRYSLSEQTAKIVKGLKENATILYFDQGTRFQHAKDLLDEFASLSPKIHVDYIDPDKNPQQTREEGIKNYGTALVQVGDRKEEAKSMTEEGITGALIRVLKNKPRTVCFVAGRGRNTVDNSDRDGYSNLKELVGKDNYDAKSIDLLQKAEVPGDCTTLVIGGPTRDYQQPEVDAIKKYVEDGGRALFMLDPPLKIGRSEIADNDALTNLLQTWGVTMDKNLILDLNPIGQLAGLGPQVAQIG